MDTRQVLTLRGSQEVREKLQDTSAGADTADVPGTLHQGILVLFQDDPWLAFDLLGLQRPVVGTPIDRRAEVDRDGKKLFQINPRFPDLVLVYRDDDDPNSGIVISVEAQKRTDPGKRWQIPVCQALLAEEHQLQTWVVVISLSDDLSATLASWAQGPPPKVDALIIDAHVVPPPISLEQARARPTEAILAAALHGYRGNLEAARIGIQVSRELPNKRRRRYTATILAALDEKLRDTLVKELKMDEYDDLMEIERQSGTFHVGRREGLEEGRKEGHKEGRRATLIEMILALLEVRNLSVDAASEQRIRDCDALPMLQGWARRARKVAQTSELFDETAHAS